MKCNIIGFAGRLASGKTELASICEKYGYEKLYFALPLKQLCADLLNITIDELNTLKRNNNVIDYFVTEECVNEIHKRTNINFDDINQTIGGKIIKNVRELLQIIGTDVIRKFNTNWHVEQIKNMIDNNVKYVIDDVRFPNEKKLIEELGGTCWYVIRPTLDNVSNHESETSLKWKNFENIIVNDNSLEYLTYHWNLFMERGYEKSLELKRKMYQKYLGKEDLTTEVKEILKNEKNKFTLHDALYIHPHQFIYSPKFIANTNIKNITQNNKQVIVTYNNNNVETITNYFEIEDLKNYI